MNIKRIGLIFTAIVLILCFIWSVDHQFSDPDLYQEIISKRALEKQSLSKKEIKARFKSLLYRYEDFEDELSSEELIFSKEDYNQDVDLDRTIPTEEALKEIDFLFRMIKYGYAGYQYFGETKLSKGQRKRLFLFSTKLPKMGNC